MQSKKNVLCMVFIIVSLMAGVACGSEPLDQMAMPQAGDPIAVISTTMGDIVVRFFPESAPLAVENFITHAENEYFDGMLFHRTIEHFMIQSGDPKGDGTGGASIWLRPFEDEFDPNLHHFDGALSMANKGPNTNASQFFIISRPPETMTEDDVKRMERAGMKEDLIARYMEKGGMSHLDDAYAQQHGHTVFGQVIEGMDVVRKIAASPVVWNDQMTERSKPREDIHILSVRIKSYQNE